MKESPGRCEEYETKSVNHPLIFKKLDQRQISRPKSGTKAAAGLGRALGGGQSQDWPGSPGGKDLRWGGKGSRRERQSAGPVSGSVEAGDSVERDNEIANDDAMR